MQNEGSYIMNPSFWIIIFSGFELIMAQVRTATASCYCISSAGVEPLCWPCVHTFNVGGRGGPTPCCLSSLAQLPHLSEQPIGWLSTVGALMPTLHMFTPACFRPSSLVQLPDLSSLP